MFLEVWRLLVWSAVALAWWVISWRLVPTEEAASIAVGALRRRTTESRLQTLTIFKPLATAGNGGAFDPAGLESFLAADGWADRDFCSACYERDLATFEPWLTRMRDRFPGRPAARGVAHGARARSETPRSRGSRSSRRTPPAISGSGAMRTSPCRRVSSRPRARSTPAAGAKMVTWSYIVGEVETAHRRSSTRFTSTSSSFPACCFCAVAGPVDFGLGAAMLFSRADFAAPCRLARARRLRWRTTSP